MAFISSYTRHISPDIKWHFFTVTFLIFSSISNHAQANGIKPRIIKFSRNQLAMPGDTIRLTCLAIGSPPLLVSWYLNGNRYLIYSNRRTQEGLLSTAEIRNIQESLHISCRAINYVGFDEKTSRIFFKANQIPPRFVVKPKPVYRFFQRSSLSIPCAAYGQPMPTVYWEKDSVRESEPPTVTSSSVRATLELNNIKESNYYTCIASSSAGTIRAVIVVIDGEGDRFPPRIKPMPDRILLDSVDEPFEQTCIAVGRPLPRPSWWHNGKFIPSQDNRTEINWQTTLSVPSVREISTYMCRAETWTEKAEARIKVYVKGLLKFVKIPPTYMVIEYGESTTLECNVAGLPLANVTWYKTIGETETGDDYDVPIQTIQTFPTSDETQATTRLQLITETGTYKCKGTSTGSPISHKTKIYVRRNYRAPRIIEFPSDVKIKPMSSIDLTCTGVGFPPPRVYWTGGGRTRHVRSARVDRGMRSTVTINNLSASKTFTCAAESAIGRTIRTVSVEIEEVLMKKPKVTTTVLVTMNSSANINCTASGNPLPKVSWRSETGRKLKGREMIIKDTKISVLHLKTVTQPQIFICVAVSSFGRVYKVVKVIPTNVPIMSITPLTYIHKGDDVNLSCQVRAPWKVLVFWHPSTKGSKQVTKSITDGRVAMLKLQHVEKPVNYTCIVLSKALSGKGTRIFYRTKHIKLLVAPNFITKPPHVQFVNKSGSLILNCSASGQPMPDVYWDWNSGNKTGLRGSANLTLTNITVSCLVRCIAKSQAGMAKTTVAVIIKGDLNFTASPDSSKQLSSPTISAKVTSGSNKIVTASPTNIPLIKDFRTAAVHVSTSTIIGTRKEITTTTTERITTPTTVPRTEKRGNQLSFRSDFSADETSREPERTVSTPTTSSLPVIVKDKQSKMKSALKSTPKFVKESISQSTEIPSTSRKELRTKTKGNAEDELSELRSTQPVTLKRLVSEKETATKKLEVSPNQIITTRPTMTGDEKQIPSPTHSNMKTHEGTMNEETFVDSVQNEESKESSTFDVYTDEKTETKPVEQGPQASLYNDGSDNDNYDNNDGLSSGDQYGDYSQSGNLRFSSSTDFDEDEDEDEDEGEDEDEDDTTDYDYVSDDAKPFESDFMYINSVK